MTSRTHKNNRQPLSDMAVGQFERDGFIVERGLADPGLCEQLAHIVDESLEPALAPLEYEADVQYPGAPESRDQQGGLTPRRLLYAYTRHPLLRQWSGSPKVVGRLRQLMGSTDILLSQNHHNCIMTKHPGYSSMTSWHEDVRYWSFDRPELVSVWLAISDEYPDNGGMLLIPGSHKQRFERGRLDATLFLRTDLPENETWINKAVSAELKAGDVLFFHCKTYHAAGKNITDEVKRSVIFTYRTLDNQPIPGTRSANFPDVPVDVN